MRDTRQQFTGIPLNCMLLAEACAEQTEIYAQNREIDLDVFLLCNRLTERNFDIYCEKYKIYRTKAGPLQDCTHIKEVFHNKHMIAGLLTLLPKEDITSVCTGCKSDVVNESTTARFMKNIQEEAKNVITEIEDGREKMGIILEVKNGIPVFIHPIYAEYYAAH
jgi:hypothetical protein